MLLRQIEEEGFVAGDERRAQFDRYERIMHPARYHMRTGEFFEWIDGKIIWGTREELDKILRDRKEKNYGR